MITGNIIPPLGVMAVVTDEHDRTSEVLDVDTIGVVRYVIDYIQGRAQVALAFGGFDSRGAFHVAPQHANNVAEITLNNPLFKTLFCNIAGNPLDFHPESLLGLIFDTAVKQAFVLCWKVPGSFQVQRHGNVVYQAEGATK